MRTQSSVPNSPSSWISNHSLFIWEYKGIYGVCHCHLLRNTQSSLKSVISYM